MDGQAAERIELGAPLARGEVQRAVVLGAGEAGRLLMAGLHQQGWVVLGLLDDDATKHGASIAGVPVLGAIDRLKDKSVWAGANRLVVAMPSASPSNPAIAVQPLRSEQSPPTAQPQIQAPVNNGAQESPLALRPPVKPAPPSTSGLGRDGDGGELGC